MGTTTKETVSLARPTRMLSVWDWLAAAIPLLVLAVMYGPTFRDVALICWNDDDYSHGLLLPLVTAYLLWDRREKLRELITLPAPNRIPWLPILLLLIGLFLYLVGAASRSLFGLWVSFFPVFVSCVLLVTHRKLALALIGPFLLLFMAKPMPDSLVPKLFGPFQRIAAQVSAWVLDRLEVPVHIVGNVIEIPGMRLLVEEACSGMRSLMALFTVAVIVCLVVSMKPWAKLLIVFVSVLVALLLNVLRVATTGVLAYFYDPESATGFFHTFSGMIVFIIGLAIVYGVAIKLQRIAPADEPRRST